MHHETRREGLGQLGRECQFKGSLELQAGVEDSEMILVEKICWQFVALVEEQRGTGPQGGWCGG